MVTPSNAIFIQLPTIDNKIAAADFVVNHRILLKYASFYGSRRFIRGRSWRKLRPGSLVTAMSCTPCWFDGITPDVPVIATTLPTPGRRSV